MCIYIFGQVICIDNVILVACATLALRALWWIKNKIYYWRMLRKAKDPDQWVDAEEVFERLDEEVKK